MADYAPLISGDPFYLQQQALYNSQSAADAARLQEQLSNLIIDFGEVPQGFTSPYLSTTAQALAQQNTQAGLSLLARLQRKTEDARNASINDLAARGILSSGETGFQLGRIQQGSLESQYDARRQLLDLIRQGSDAFAQAELQRKLGLIDAAQNAYGRQLARPANTQIGGGGVGFEGVGGPVGPGEDAQGGPLVGDPGQGPAAPGFSAPSAAQIAKMAKWVPYAKAQRPEGIRNLFQQYGDWRAATPNWWG